MAKKPEAHSTSECSFHLRLLLGSDYKLPHDCSAVDVLRTPFLEHNHFHINRSPTTGTIFESEMMEKFNPSLSARDKSPFWIDRYMIVTDKRIFLVSKRLSTPNEADFGTTTGNIPTEDEIVDSIPLEEIQSVTKYCLDAVQQVQSDSVPSRHSQSFKWFKLVVQGIGEKVKPFKSQIFDDPSSLAKPAGPNQTRIEKFEEVLRAFSQREPWKKDNILKIETIPRGFNSGVPYYFRLKADPDHLLQRSKILLTFAHCRPATEGPVGNDRVSGGHPQQHKPFMRFPSQHALLRSLSGKALVPNVQKRVTVRELAAELRQLATARVQALERKSRLAHLRRRLKRMWDSAWFNAIVLVLLASNFILIIQEVENRDPDMTPYFKRVNICYTVAFSVGALRPCDRARLQRGNARVPLCHCCAFDAVTNPSFRAGARAADRAPPQLPRARGESLRHQRLVSALLYATA
jgi:hypothetical protein